MLEGVQQVDKRVIAEFGVLVAKKILRLFEFDIMLMFKEASLFKNKETTATFLRETYVIVFNNKWLDNSSDVEIIACAFHEVRHAYQQAQIDFREQLEIQETKEVIKIWKDEIKDYKQSTGKYDNDTEYLSQELEIDATAFEKFLITELFNVEHDIHFEIRDIVNKRLTDFKFLIEGMDLPKVDLKGEIQ